LANGQFLKVPTLLGNTADEGYIFAVIEQLLLTNTTNPVVTEALSVEITQVRMNKHLAMCRSTGLLYFKVTFECPAAASAAGRAKAHVPTFRYRYEGQSYLISSSFIPDLTSMFLQLYSLISVHNLTSALITVLRFPLSLAPTTRPPFQQQQPPMK
jgi:carboxylesterase type B